MVYCGGGAGAAGPRGALARTDLQGLVQAGHNGGNRGEGGVIAGHKRCDGALLPHPVMPALPTASPQF